MPSHKLNLVAHQVLPELLGLELLVLALLVQVQLAQLALLVLVLVLLVQQQLARFQLVLLVQQLQQQQLQQQLQLTNHLQTQHPLDQALLLSKLQLVVKTPRWGVFFASTIKRYCQVPDQAGFNPFILDV